MPHLESLAYFQSKQSEMLDAIRFVVIHETPSSDKSRLDHFAQLLADRFQAAGAIVDVVVNPDGGNHVRARLHPATVEASTRRQALVLCHFDTVWPVGSVATHPFRIEDGKAYGPGIFDMQTSLILTEYVLRAVRDLHVQLPRPVTVLMTSDEEVGSKSSWRLIEEEAANSEYVLVMESPLPGGVLKTARKGSGHFVLEVAGKAAHAGVEPERGVSAALELAHQIIKLHDLNDYAVGTTINVGVIEGGTASNVVPAFASAEIDVRTWDQAETDRITAAIMGLQPVLSGAHLRISGGVNRPPLERKVTMDLFQQARKIGVELGLDLQEGSTGGGSDGNITGALGIPTLDGLGVPGHGAHADHEHIQVDQIAGRAALLLALLQGLRVE